MAEGANCCVKFVVYLLIFCNIVGGILLLVGAPVSYESSEEDYSTSSSPSVVNISTGIISICLGILLLYGAIKENARCVLVYLVLMCIGAVIRTGFTIYILVNFGSVLGWFVVLPIVLVVILWALVYCVYLFHKSLVEQSEVSYLDTDPSFFNKEEIA